MTYYIIWKSRYGIETIDEFKSETEANRCLGEYRMAYNEGTLSVSQTCTSDWDD